MICRFFISFQRFQLLFILIIIIKVHEEIFFFFSLWFCFLTLGLRTFPPVFTARSTGDGWDLPLTMPSERRRSIEKEEQEKIEVKRFPVEKLFPIYAISKMDSESLLLNPGAHLDPTWNAIREESKLVVRIYLILFSLYCSLFRNC